MTSLPWYSVARREREEELRRAVADLVRERLRAEVSDRLPARVAAVPEAVLGRVAVDDERRAQVQRVAVRSRPGSGAAGDLDHVAADPGRACLRVALGDDHVRVRRGAERTAGDRHRGAGESLNRPDEGAADGEGLADFEAGARPRHAVATRDRRRRRREVAAHLDARVAAAVDGNEAAVHGDLAEAAVRVVIRAGHERAADGQVVVALAEEDVQHLDRRSSSRSAGTPSSPGRRRSCRS